MKIEYLQSRHKQTKRMAHSKKKKKGNNFNTFSSVEGNGDCKDSVMVYWSYE